MSNPNKSPPSGSTAAPSSTNDSELRLEEIMEALRQGRHAPDLVERAIAENPELASRIRDDVALERNLRESAPPLAPLRIGRYHIRGELAHGGMGKIYKGWDSELYRHVAIKTVRQDLPSAEYKFRFLREQRILARLHE